MACRDEQKCEAAAKEILDEIGAKVRRPNLLLPLSSLKESWFCTGFGFCNCTKM